jgi:hypothetical protein
MKVIISGSRWIQDYKIVADAIAESGFKPTLIIEGGQRSYSGYPVAKIVGGVDWLASQWAKAHGVEVHTEYALWDVHGKSAGPIRNRVMAEMGDVLIAIPEGKSKGTRDMILAMRLLNKPIFVKEVIAETLYKHHGNDHKVECK